MISCFKETVPQSNSTFSALSDFRSFDPIKPGGPFNSPPISAVDLGTDISQEILRTGMINISGL